MLVTDQAKLIRTTVGSVRVTGRNTQGVILFRVADDEHVVSAARIDEEENPENPAEEAVAGELAADTVGDGIPDDTDSSDTDPDQPEE